MIVLVTGATGYVGGRLVPRLLQEGHRVRVGVRDSGKELPWWANQVEVIEFDALDARTVSAAVVGTDAVYYLIHGMGGDDFVETDRAAAKNMLAALDEHEVPRVVYLSGIVPDAPQEELSAHISSRVEVESILALSTAIALSLRAAVLLGSGSTSFEVIRQVSERMRVETLPASMHSTVQPIAIVDALEALVGALTVETESRHYDVGGPEALPYRDLLARYARVAGLDRSQVVIPPPPDRIVKTLAGRMVDVPTSVVESLVESLHHDMVCDGAQVFDLLPRGHDLMDVDTAIARALQPAPEPGEDLSEADPMGPMPHDPDWAGGGDGSSLGAKVSGALRRLLR